MFNGLRYESYETTLPTFHMFFHSTFHIKSVYSNSIKMHLHLEYVYKFLFVYASVEKLLLLQKVLRCIFSFFTQNCLCLPQVSCIS